MSTIDSAGNIHKGAGAPGGGQFAGRVNTAPTGTLTDDESTLCARCDNPATYEDGLCDQHTLQWGYVDVHMGSRTPWGGAQHVTPIAPGFVSVSTAGHGGVKLSRERNSLIPTALRNSNGWYEEDCEINIPLHYFPEAWARLPHVTASVDELTTSTDQAIKDWFPDKWEAANGRELEPGESQQKDRLLWTTAHENHFVVTSARAAETDPEVVRVTSRRKSDGAVAEFLVPRAEYDTRRDGDRGRDGRFAVDPARHPMLPPAPDIPKPAPVLHKPRIPTAIERQADPTLTPTARNRIAKDLNKRWRQEDGSVLTLREIIEQQGVSGKSAYSQGASIKYALTQPTPNGIGHYSLAISKATFDYLQSVPDDRTPAQRAQQAAFAYRVRIDSKPGGPTPQEQERERAMYLEYRALADAEQADRVAREGTHEQKKAAEARELADRERAATISV